MIPVAYACDLCGEMTVEFLLHRLASSSICCEKCFVFYAIRLSEIASDWMHEEAEAYARHAVKVAQIENAGLAFKQSVSLRR